MGQPDSSQSPSDDSLGSSFLRNVDPSDRPVLEKYIKEWDAGVTRRFQSIHDQYRPYKELGADPKLLQEAYSVYTVLNQDPMLVYNFLQEQLADQLNEQTEETVTDYSGDPTFEGLPEPFAERFTRLEEIVTKFADTFIQSQQQQAQAQEDAALEAHLKDLSGKFGEFDEDWVVAKIAKGMSGEEAVKAYQNFVQKIVNDRSTKRPIAPVMGGVGGSVPNSQRSPGDMSRAETKSLVAQMLAAANEG